MPRIHDLSPIYPLADGRIPTSRSLPAF